MKLPVTSNSTFRFYNLGAANIDSPGEWEAAILELPVREEDWERAIFRLQGASLPVYLKKLGGKARVLVDWPRSGPGHYDLTLELAGSLIAREVVTIYPSKINSESFKKLLEDLELNLPAVIALGLKRLGGLAGVELVPPHENIISQEVERLRRALAGSGGKMGLIKVLQSLSEDYYQTLARNEVWIRAEKSRRPIPSKLALAFANHANLDHTGKPLKLAEERVEHNPDVYENRLVKVFYHQVHLRLRRLIGILEISSQSGQNGDVLAEARKGLGLLQKARTQAGFLDKVSLPGHLPNQVSMVLLKKPPYQAALASFLEFHKQAIVRLEEPALDAPLENLPYLYQVWGTLKVIQALLEVGAELGFEVKKQELAHRKSSEVFVKVLRDGSPCLVLSHPVSNTTVKLIPERTYRRTGPLHSISFDQRPDIAIEVEKGDGSTAVYLFDPKYKLDSSEFETSTEGTPKKIDIDKMHTYRDAIRGQNQEIIVQYAAILYPGKTITYSSGLEAVQSYPNQSETALEEKVRIILRRALEPIRI